MAKKNPADIDEEIIYVSKSELKRDAQEFQSLGREIAEMGKKQRQKIPLTQELVEAFNLADRIQDKKDAYRRHLNYIAKTLRTTESIAEIQHALDVLKNKHKQADVILHQIELLRDELITKGDARINTLLEQHPNLERQRMRQLVRQATKEVEQEKPGKSYKELFQYLKEAMM